MGSQFFSEFKTLAAKLQVKCMWNCYFFENNKYILVDRHRHGDYFNLKFGIRKHTFPHGLFSALVNGQLLNCFHLKINLLTKLAVFFIVLSGVKMTLGVVHK